MSPCAGKTFLEATIVLGIPDFSRGIESVEIMLQDDIDHAGNRVGAVQR